MENHNPKIPVTEYPVAPFVINRWSPRSYSDRLITEKELHTLIEAASWVPSSMNEQPWVYVYAHRGSAAFKRFYACLSVGNQLWAGKAAVLLLSLARKNFKANGVPNRHAMHDVGAANTTLLLQGATMGIYGHIMGGFDMQKAIETLEIPDDMEVVAFLALGFLDAPEKLEEPFKTRETQARSRKAVTEVLFEDVVPG